MSETALGNWDVVFQVQLPDVPPVTEPIQSVGIDMGLEYFATLSTGETIENPRWFRTSEKQLAKLQKVRARCRKGSKQYRYLTDQIRRCHQKITHQRRDFHHQLSRQLVDRYGVIFVERLNIKGLAKSHVSKSMADAGWDQFLFMSAYKAAWAGGEQVEVDARGTSQLCPRCGCSVKKSLSDRIHSCLACGYIAPRDVAAAQVIELRGLAGIRPDRKVFPSFGGSVEAPPL